MVVLEKLNVEREVPLKFDTYEELNEYLDREMEENINKNCGTDNLDYWKWLNVNSIFYSR